MSDDSEDDKGSSRVTAEERRDNRQRLREMNADLVDNSTEMRNIRSSKFPNMLRRYETIARSMVNPNTRELISSANCLRHLTRAVKGQAQILTDVANRLSWQELSTSITNRFSNDGLHGGLDWEKFGSEARCVFKSTSSFTTMVGPIHKEERVRKITVRRQRENTAGVVNVTAEKVEHDEDDGNDEATNARVAKLLQLIESFEGQEFDLLKTLVDPVDPVQSVENFFDYSYLHKEKRVKHEFDEETGTLIASIACPEELEKLPKKQMVLSFTMNDLKKLAQILHPDASKGASSNSRNSNTRSRGSAVTHPLHREDPLYDAQDAREQVEILAQRAIQQKAQKNAAGGRSSLTPQSLRQQQVGSRRTQSAGKGNRASNAFSESHALQREDSLDSAAVALEQVRILSESTAQQKVQKSSARSSSSSAANGASASGARRAENQCPPLEQSLAQLQDTQSDAQSGKRSRAATRAGGEENDGTEDRARSRDIDRTSSRGNDGMSHEERNDERSGANRRATKSASDGQASSSSHRHTSHISTSSRAQPAYSSRIEAFDDCYDDYDDYYDASAFDADFSANVVYYAKDGMLPNGTCSSRYRSILPVNPISNVSAKGTPPAVKKSSTSPPGTACSSGTAASVSSIPAASAHISPAFTARTSATARGTNTPGTASSTSTAASPPAVVASSPVNIAVLSRASRASSAAPAGRASTPGTASSTNTAASAASASPSTHVLTDHIATRRAATANGAIRLDMGPDEDIELGIQASASRRNETSASRRVPSPSITPTPPRLSRSAPTNTILANAPDTHQAKTTLASVGVDTTTDSSVSLNSRETSRTSTPSSVIPSIAHNDGASQQSKSFSLTSVKRVLEQEEKEEKGDRHERGETGLGSQGSVKRRMIEVVTPAPLSTRPATALIQAHGDRNHLQGYENKLNGLIDRTASRGSQLLQSKRRGRSSPQSVYSERTEDLFRSASEHDSDSSSI